MVIAPCTDRCRPSDGSRKHCVVTVYRAGSFKAWLAGFHGALLTL